MIEIGPNHNEIRGPAQTQTTRRAKEGRDEARTKQAD